MKSFFDIPVYRLRKEQYESEQSSFILREMSAGGEFVQEMYRRDPNHRKRMEQHFLEIYGGHWRFNEIIGFIRLYFFFTQIRGEYWRVTAKKIMRTRKKLFTYSSHNVTIEEEIPAISTNAEIYALIQKYLVRAQNQNNLKKFHIDKSVFENIGPHVDWNGLRKSNGVKSTELARGTKLSSVPT